MFETLSPSSQQQFALKIHSRIALDFYFSKHLSQHGRNKDLHVWKIFIRNGGASRGEALGSNAHVFCAWVANCMHASSATHARNLKTSIRQLRQNQDTDIPFPFRSNIFSFWSVTRHTGFWPKRMPTSDVRFWKLVHHWFHHCIDRI